MIVVQGTAQKLKVPGFAVDVDSDLIAVGINVDAEARRMAAMRPGIAVAVELAVNGGKAEHVQWRETAPSVVPAAHIDQSHIAADPSGQHAGQSIVIADIHSVAEPMVQIEVPQLDILAAI